MPRVWDLNYGLGQVIVGLSIGELGALGFRLAIHPGAMVRVVGHAATNYLETLRSEGTTRGMLDRMFDFKRLNERRRRRFCAASTPTGTGPT